MVLQNSIPKLLRSIVIVTATMLISLPAQAETYAVDGDTIELNGTRIRINGIDAPEYGQKCGEWACGKAAADFMARLLKSGRPHCTIHSEDNYGRSIATCTVNGRDIGAEMVATGHAWAFEKFSDRYINEQTIARKSGVGVWATDAIPAWEYRANAWASAEQTAPAGCPIKGNITKNGHIYHAPWSPWYARTRINEAKGERWFCSEGDAIKAGWRAPN